jgi:uncharacterized membrane protein
LTAREGGSKHDMNAIISDLLKYGVILSTALVVLGLLIIAAHAPPTFPTTVEQLVSSNYGRPTLDLGVLVSGVAAGSPLFVLQLGLLILLATPVVRVFASIILFAAERDRTYVAITLLVFGILLFSIFVVGPAVAAA